MAITETPTVYAAPGSPGSRVELQPRYGSAIQDGIDPVAFGAVTLAGIALAIAGAEVFRRRDVLA
jgi:hypothetical protein